eukprot:3621320-Rhodomonas_salina.1
MLKLDPGHPLSKLPDTLSASCKILAEISEISPEIALESGDHATRKRVGTSRAGSSSGARRP